MLNSFQEIFSKDKLVSWYDCIAQRKSCRHFSQDTRPDLDVMDEFRLFIDNIFISSARAILVENSKELSPFIDIPLITSLSSAPYYIVIAANTDSRNENLFAGFLCEAIVLEATRLGLSNIIVTGTYSKSKVKCELYPDERIAGLIGIGICSKEVKQRPRKQLKSLCSSDPYMWKSSWAPKVAEAIRKAPSAINSQPWRFSFENSTMSLKLSKFNSLESGIALLHALCACTEQNIKLSFNEISHQIFLQEDA